MEERTLRGDILLQPVIPQPLAYPDMLETCVARERNGIRFENELGSRESNGIGKELESFMSGFLCSCKPGPEKKFLSCVIFYGVDEFDGRLTCGRISVRIHR